VRAERGAPAALGEPPDRVRGGGAAGAVEGVGVALRMASAIAFRWRLTRPRRNVQAAASRALARGRLPRPPTARTVAESGGPRDDGTCIPHQTAESGYSDGAFTQLRNSRTPTPHRVGPGPLRRSPFVQGPNWTTLRRESSPGLGPNRSPRELRTQNPQPSRHIASGQGLSRRKFCVCSRFSESSACGSGLLRSDTGFRPASPDAHRLFLRVTSMAVTACRRRGLGVRAIAPVFACCARHRWVCRILRAPV
jgi:hypothetical protein